MGIHVSTLILGASCYGCGIALRRPDSLILEPTIQPGAEFTLTGCPAGNLAFEPESAAGRSFLEELRRRSVICDGMLHNDALAPVLANWCLDHRLHILFKALPVRQEESRVTVMQADGLREYSADEIIDARPKITTPHLCTFLAKAVPGVFGDFVIFRTLMKDLFVMRQRLFPGCGYASARKRLREFWEDRPESLRQAALLWSATRFCNDTIDNPVFELERGIRRGEE